MNYFIIILLVIITVIYLNFNHTEKFINIQGLGDINLDTLTSAINNFGNFNNLLDNANKFNSCKNAYITLQKYMWY